MSATDDALEPLPEDWDRALAVVAHPDDMEYGASSAVARWTDQGKRVDYLLVTKGEAGIATSAPDATVAVRRVEQRRSCDAVGVTDLDFLDHPDGLVVESLELRRDLAAAIRRRQPEVIVSINHRDTWGGSSWNHADHRAVGRALLDAVRDAANRWVFPSAGPAWGGVRLVAFSGSPEPTHAVDVSETLDRGIASLACHRSYLEALDDHPDPDPFLRSIAAAAGPRLGCRYATTFEVVVP